MATNTEINLGQAVHTVELRDVDEHGNLHAVRLFEDDGLKGAATPGRFTGQGLADLTEAGKEERKNGSGRQFVDAAAPSGHVVQGPLVVALHQLDVGLLQQGLDQSRNEVGGGVEDVGVEKDHDLRGGRSETGAHGLALSARAIQRDYLGSVVVGHGGGVVVGVVVHDQKLVDQAGVVGHRIQHGPDGRGFVFGRNDDADRCRRRLIEHAIEVVLVTGEGPGGVVVGHLEEDRGSVVTAHLTNCRQTVRIDRSSRATEGRAR